MRKLLSAFIAAVMVFSMFPAMIFTSSADEAVDAVAKIGDVGYASLSDAIGSAAAGDTVVLQKDVTADNLSTDSFAMSVNKDVTLDMNGYSVRSANQYGAIYLNQGMFTIVNSSENAAEIYAEDTAADGSTAIGYEAVYQNGGHLVVDGKVKISGRLGVCIVGLTEPDCKITLKNGAEICGRLGDGIQTYFANKEQITLNLTVENATVTGAENAVVVDQKDGNAISVSGANSAVNGTVRIDKGTTLRVKDIDYRSLNVTCSSALETNITTAEDGSTVYTYAGSITVDEETDKPEAELNGVQYDTSAEAYALAQSGDTIKLIAKTVELPYLDKSGITIEGTAIDGRYTEVKIATKSNECIKANDLTIKNVIFGMGGSPMTPNYTCNNITFEGCQFRYAIQARGKNYTFKDCLFNGTDGIYYAAVSGYMNIDGCTFEVLQRAIHNETSNCTMNITNSNIASYCPMGPNNHVVFDNCNFYESGRSAYGDAWYLPNMYCDTVVNNCTFEGKTFIGINGTDIVVELNNCEFKNGATAETVTQDVGNNVFVIDGTKDENGKYVSGTVVGKEEKTSAVVAEGYQTNENGEIVAPPALESFKIAPAEPIPSVFYPGDSIQLAVTDIQPEGASVDNIEWSMVLSGGNYYSVDQNGLVKNIKSTVSTYKVRATVTNEDGNKITADFTTPKQTTLPALTPSPVELKVGESAVITAEALEAIGVEDITFSVSSTYEKYVSVNNGTGNATVTASFADEHNNCFAIVNANGTRNGVSVSKSVSVKILRDMENSLGDVRKNVNVCIGQNIKFTTPSAFAGHDVVWSVSDENILQVDQEGNVTVKAMGATQGEQYSVYVSAVIDGVECTACTYLNVYEKVVAEITVNGVTYYEHTLPNAINRVPTNATAVIKLLCDVTESSQISISRRYITLDLGDYVITSTFTGGSSNNSAVIVFFNNSSLTVNAGNGGIISESNTFDVGKRLTIGSTQDGILTINGGNYISKGGAEVVYVAAGKATINGGHFELTDGSKTFLLNCNDTSRKEGKASITVNGGTFVDFDPMNNAAEGANTNFVAEGLKTTVDENGNYVIVEDNDPYVNTEISFTVGNTMTLNLFVTDSIYGNAYTAEHCTAFVDVLANGEWLEIGSADLTAADATVNGDTAEMKFSVGGIPMAYLSDNLRIRFCAYGGEKTYSLELTELTAGVSLSFASYAESAKELNADNAELVSLLNTMLNYTAAVQQYKGHNAENLANSSLSEEEKAVTSIKDIDFSAEYPNALKRGVSSNASAKVKFDGSQLLMNSDKTGFRFYFTLDDGVDVSTLELQVKYNGKTVKIPASVFKSRGNGQYSAIFEGLDPTEFDVQLTAAIFAGGARISNVAYDSIPATAKLVSENDKYAGMVNVYSAMLAYCEAAKAYFKG